MFGLSKIVWVVINSVVSFVYLFVISKILGKKQIAQLEFVDYVIGISLGSIAGEFATDADNPFYFYLIAMGIFFVFSLILSLIGRKNSFLKRLLKGKPSTLIYDGKINYRELTKTKLDVNDLLSMLREKNYFDINDVAYAIFEPSGELSVLPKGSQKPVVIEDINGKAVQAELTNILIVDGEISYSGLKEAGKEASWLMNELGECELDNIILATYDKAEDKLKTFLKTDKLNQN